MIPSLLLLCLPALAGPSLDIDLDGDGTKDAIVIGDRETTVGKAQVDCSLSEACRAELVDVSNADRFREVVLCTEGPRAESYCRLYRYDKGTLTELVFTRTLPDDKKPGRTQTVDWAPSSILTKGNGIVLGDFASRWYTRREKWTAEGTTLKHHPQPAYWAEMMVPVDRSFPITTEPGGGEVVANVAPGTTITALLESGTHPDWFLVRISSGLLGWCSLDQLIQASDQMMMTAGAG
ncbi:MAG: hypothetical protein H6742_17545 [Alphaproteobacteria bacterium]|nr:hypothetical protein [Alphaproteobacteria bacterium]